VANTTYRTDWLSDDGKVQVRHHGDNLKAARADARRISNAIGSAYIIRSVDGVDDGQIGYYDGRADGRTWEA
jgi:hypothetical protein